MAILYFSLLISQKLSFFLTFKGDIETFKLEERQLQKEQITDTKKKAKKINIDNFTCELEALIFFWPIKKSMSSVYNIFLVKTKILGVQHICKIYLIIDQQIAQHFVQYSECLSNPPSLLCNSNNQPFSYFKNLSQSR